jgi:DNA-binding transcriptional LysR family regulator
VNNSVDLHLLRCCEALLGERNVSRAARKLGMSQPAMSHALARLRRVFDDPLLIKGNGAMTPTVRAVSLDAQVREVLAAADRLLHPPVAFAPATACLTFTVMAAEYVEYLLMPMLISRLQREAPGVVVLFRSAERDRALGWLERGELDFRFGWWPESAQTLRAKKLFRDPLVCIARKGHPEIRGAISEELYLATPHVCVQPERMGVAVRAVQRAAAAKHRELHVRFQVQNALALCNAVASSDLVGTLPERLARALALKFPLQVLPIPLNVPDVRQAMYWHERTHKQPGHQWFRQLIADIVKTL